MDTNSALGQELQALEQKWEQITDVPETPRSLMDVIEYSLGSQKKAEVYVNRLLAYLLDPEEPHGMDAELLKEFLLALPAKCGFQEDVRDLSDVDVDDQVRVEAVENGTASSTGLVDLLIEMPNEWFLMIELKFSAKDTQTEFYYQEATHVGGQPKTDYESGRYYLYLHQHDQPVANEPNFANLSWKQFSADVLEPFLMQNASRYPQRTVAQLRELNDDIQNISGMTEQQENQQEKVEMYLEHYDAITDVSDTFDSRWENFTDEWGTRLGESLEQAGLATYTVFDEDLIAVEVASATEEHRSWKFRTSSSDWGMMFKDGWWRHTDELTGEIYSRPDDRNDVRIGFHHRLGRNRDLAIGDRTLKVYFRNMGANDQAFIDAFADSFADHRTEIRDVLPSAGEVTGNKRDMLVAAYDVEADSNTEFFDAYIAALEKAFYELVVNNSALIAIIDEVYSESIRDVYGVPK